MESFENIIDYKRPIGLQDDMRTSTYRAHKYVHDNLLGNVIPAKYKEIKTYREDPEIAKRNVSNYKANFQWKYSDPNEVRNPSLDQKILFLKSLDETKLKFVKRPIRPAVSVSHQDYIRKQVDPEATAERVQMPTGVGTTAVTVNRAKVGFSKYLDSSATTQRIDYVAYTPQEILHSIAKHDNITFWNWEKIQQSPLRVFRKSDGQMCDGLATKECPKRRCEFPSLIKHVPHSGMTTEFRSNYLDTYRRVIDHDITHIRNKLEHCSVEPFPNQTDTEYALYGSGERTQNYV